MSEFYVYAYLRTDGSPYYIGKGKKRRAYSNWRKIPRPKDESRIQILEYFTDESKAFAKEKELIAQYGRRDQGTGILRNLSDGGEGGANPSEETRRKMRESKLGKKPMLGKKHSEEAKEKLRQAKLGKKHSEETKEKLRQAHTNPSEETRRRLRESHLGKKLSEETKRKISISNTNPSEETREKIRKSRLGKKPYLGKKHSEETKKKMSISQRNRSPVSEETREKMRVAAKKREESKRNK